MAPSKAPGRWLSDAVRLYLSLRGVALAAHKGGVRSGFGKMHTGFKSTKHLWYNRGFTSAVGSLLTGGDYYNANPSAGVRWQDDHPLFSVDHFDNPPPDCTAQTKEPGNGTCVNEYSTALWGQAAIQAAADHKLPAPLYIHLCFQAVHEPYDPPPGPSKTVRQ